jgi:aminoglycoside phosphotransferase
MLAGPPQTPVVTPGAVESLINGRPFEVVWLNGLGGLTFRIEDTTSSVYVKWVPVASEVDVADEIEKLRWASAYTPVPTLIDHGSDSEGYWIVTQSIDAENAVSARWRREPKRATAALGAGLRAFHDALPKEGCPYEWSVALRLHEIRRRVNEGLLNHHEWSEGFSDFTLRTALEVLRVTPSEDLVVCHGDACAPNTLIDEHGKWVAHVDLQNLGIGDRWADLAILTWSTVWNYGEGWEMNVYDSYGIEPDLEKIRFHRLLWELEE